MCACALRRRQELALVNLTLPQIWRSNLFVIVVSGHKPSKDIEEHRRLYRLQVCSRAVWDESGNGDFVYIHTYMTWTYQKLGDCSCNCFCQYKPS